jgi:carbonic anhydrase/acetyltransferase-like protein (isoleucine patch superfamily)
MSLYQFKNFTPLYDKSCYFAPGSQIIGNVHLSENVSIWNNTVLRGDVNSIEIGAGTNIQDLSLLHVTELNKLRVGERTSVGHSVTLHGCEVGNECLIGMGATILDGAIIEDQCLVAAGSLVPPGKHYPKGSMIMGSPAMVKRELTEEEIHFISNHYKSYIGYKDEFRNYLVPISR